MCIFHISTANIEKLFKRNINFRIKQPLKFVTHKKCGKPGAHIQFIFFGARQKILWQLLLRRTC